MKEHMKLLGLKVKDRVTGFTGVVSSVSFDLYGCVQAVVTPEAAKDGSGKLEHGCWFDVKRLEVLESNPVMEPPTFETSDAEPVEVAGPEYKSLPRTSPL